MAYLHFKSGFFMGICKIKSLEFLSLIVILNQIKCYGWPLDKKPLAKIARPNFYSNYDDGM